MIVINDQNYTNFLNQGRRGYFGMFPSESERKGVKTFVDLGIDLIDPSEWDDRINELEKSKSTIPDLCKQMRLPCKYQKSTNYCWVSAPTHLLEIIRLLETGQIISYSPASAGAPIKNFRNIGGWGSQALEYFIKNGINLSTDWPDTEINSKYFTDLNKAKAKKNLVLEYYVLNSFEERVTCWLSGIPTADGYNWWRHEVCGTHILKQSHDIVIRNSWGMDWGDEGFAVLSGNKKYADDSIAITAMLAI